MEEYGEYRAYSISSNIGEGYKHVKYIVYAHHQINRRKRQSHWLEYNVQAENPCHRHWRGAERV